MGIIFLDAERWQNHSKPHLAMNVLSLYISISAWCVRCAHWHLQIAVDCLSCRCFMQWDGHTHFVPCVFDSIPLLCVYRSSFPYVYILNHRTMYTWLPLCPWSPGTVPGFIILSLVLCIEVGLNSNKQISCVYFVVSLWLLLKLNSICKKQKKSSYFGKTNQL